MPPNATEDHVIRHYIITAEVNLSLRPKSDECLHLGSPPSFLIRRVWTWRVFSSSSLPLSLTTLAWPGGCVSIHQLYNLETWGLLQGSHRNLKYFDLIRSLRNQQNAQGESLVSFHPWPLWGIWVEEEMGEDICTAYRQGHPCKSTLNINCSTEASQVLEESK